MAGQAERLPAQRSGTFLLGGDLPVVRLGYGAMQLTGPGVWGEPRDRGEARAVLRRAVELGVDFIDTADSYGPYVSEEIIAEALYPYGESLVIATKAGLVRTGPGEWHPVGRPEYLRQEVEMSLRRLRLERIDLLQLHRIDPQVPVADQIGVLADMKAEGKIRHIGVSEVSVEEIEQVRSITEIVSVQNLYNLANRKSEAVLEYAERQGLGFIPWFPMATGELAKPGGPLASIAQEHGATPAQLALAWLLRRSPVMLPIPGTSSVAHLEENVAAAEVELTDDEFESLSRAV
ncbi:aldo/keto reductase [Microtetraspora malaysiensis]|uniref:aldo/keto reductase n=1 Tax=Microtetraspora malaysiensis TaxID=161358 RepID=UPI000830D829|nr:aldo/keto reductase [Microtetraspora malaysiensis]